MIFKKASSSITPDAVKVIVKIENTVKSDPSRKEGTSENTKNMLDKIEGHFNYHTKSDSAEEKDLHQLATGVLFQQPSRSWSPEDGFYHIRHFEI